MVSRFSIPTTIFGKDSLDTNLLLERLLSGMTGTRKYLKTLSFVCPRCRADKGQRCLNSRYGREGQKRRRPHRERLKQAQRVSPLKG